ncbi:hypothetical protein Mapa_015929 [Marchantia paleacea]|nr:hypothetical protein Mapa_015929 [Marchantia paleacea]
MSVFFQFTPRAYWFLQFHKQPTLADGTHFTIVCIASEAGRALSSTFGSSSRSDRLFQRLLEFVLIYRMSDGFLYCRWRRKCLRE